MHTGLRLAVPPPNAAAIAEDLRASVSKPRNQHSNQYIEFREFLNSDLDLTAFAQVTDTYLKLADCNRIISLEFSLGYTPDIESLERSMDSVEEKLQRLLAAIRVVADNAVMQYNSKRADLTTARLLVQKEHPS